MKRRCLVGLAAGVILLALSWRRFTLSEAGAELSDQDLAALRGGRAPTTYCNPHPNCTGQSQYCSDAFPGANAGDPCTPGTATLYYNPEHCSEQFSDRVCTQPTTVDVYCLTVATCVTAFSGTTKYCTEGLVFHQHQQVTTDMTRCRNIFLFQSGPLGP